MDNELERQSEHFAAIQEMANVGTWEVNLSSNHLYWSEQTYRIHEVSPDDYTPSVETAIQFYTPESQVIITAALEHAIQTGEGYSLELEIITANKRRLWIHTYCSVKRKNDKVFKLYGVIQDIDEIKRTRLELERSEFLFRSQFDLGKTGLAITSLEKGWIKVNQALTEITGYSKEELFKLTWADLTHPDDLDRDVKEFEKLISGESQFYRMDKRYIRKDGSIVFVHITVACYRKDNKVEFFVASIQDITERKLAEEKIQKLAHFDSLTGLPNRVMAEARFQHSLQTAERDNSSVCIMFLDLDEFKDINDSLGHRAGDLYLIEIAQRIKNIVRKSDTICRQGGDEFLVIIESVSESKQLVLLAEKILEAVKLPFDINGVKVSASVSIGIAMAPDDGYNFETLCRHADMAMYQAKHSGRNAISFYNKQLELNAESKIKLLADLRIAIHEKQFELFYQPKIALQSNTIVGAEALIRWHHPEKGVISPLDFIPLAESSGLIVELGKWILEKACQQCKQWQESGLQNLSVAVNVSAIQFKRHDFFSTVKDALSQSNLSPDALELELTESLLIADSKKLAKLFSQLDQLGVNLSIDDFGTGYSNLAYLKSMNIDTLKVDRAFISKLQFEEQDQAIVEAILQMAKSLQIDVIAEGVEDRTTAAILRALNCHLAQGYYWSKPLGFDAFIQYCREQPPAKLVDSKQH